MDRIQKALEKAKQKYGNQPSGNAVASRSNHTTQVKAAQETQASPIQNIAYTQTQVQEASPVAMESNRVIAGHYNNPQSAVFRMLRTQVLQKMRTNRWQSLGVTSPTAGEGKSMVACNLAVAIAMELNQTVLLVDMDLRNPSVAKDFNVDVELGLRDYLEQDIPLQQVLVNPGIKRLVLLPGLGRAEDSAELLSSPKMANLVNDIKSQYDSRMIIFDMPPLLQTDDVLLSSSYFDSTLLVLEDGKNNEANLKKALQLLEGNHLLGTVINKSERLPAHQNY